MSTFISEPGTRLGGRYRLEDRLSASSEWAAWKAIDETLARPVTVLTFAPGFSRIGEVVTAARAASRLTDARLAQVFDVEEDWDHAYVVMEWVGGDTLSDMLADGPLDPGQGAEIIAQAAEALAAAHAAGVAHLCLNPASLHLTPGGGVKVVGLGIDAALAGTDADDPALADTYGLGRLLYAALTAHWPGDDWPGLPPAPESDGHPASPRQVRAGVPTAIDEITCQAMIQRPTAGGPPLATPEALAAALAREVPAPAALPPALSQLGFSPDDTAAGPGTGPDYWGMNGQPSRRAAGPGDIRRGRPPAAPRAMIVLVVLLVVAAIGLGVWTFGHHASTPSHPPAHHPAPQGAAVSVLKPVSAHGFDALSPASQDHSNENDYQAPRAIDGNPNTAWHTQYYFDNPRFGGLKTGTGLILDMGTRVRLASVTVTFGPIPGANVRIEIGNSNVRSPGTLPDFTTVARRTGVAGPQTFRVHSTATGRYVLIWFTKLPPKAGQASRYEGEIYNVVVRGTS